MGEKVLGYASDYFNGKICSFTGYRSYKLNESLSWGGNDIGDIYTALNGLLIEKIKAGFSIFQCGMALGADTIFAEEIIRLRDNYPYIQLTAVIPCPHQEERWRESEKEQYYNLLRLSDIVTYTSTNYFNGCMQVRNRYLVDNCDELIAIYDGKKGGSDFTVKYAIKKNKKVTIIDPKNCFELTLLN
ncbi:MAG: DUF1273 domain-containing protein [Eubacterium sp.]|jgi:uncharacterized phage-like protein YoqJ|nr:DUF1273 domain-containing protein [Eubacterium sp.]